ncbi:MAG: F0F1 ATP synthase subunit alpha [bacterium]
MSEVLISDSVDILSNELLQLALEDEAIDVYRESLRIFIEDITHNYDLNKAFFDKSLTPEVKKRTIRERFTGILPSKVLGYISKIIEDGEEELIEQVYTRFIDLVETSLPLKVRVKLPFNVSDEKIKEIGSYLSEVLNRKVVILTEVDPNIINGVRIELQDETIDVSLKAQLDLIRDELSLVEAKDSFQGVIKDLKDKVEGFLPKPLRLSTGRVKSIRDCVVVASGLKNSQYGEMVLFSNNIPGMVMSLEEEETGIILLGSPDEIPEGDIIRSTQRMLTVPVGEELKGRVIDPLGRPLDGGPPITTNRYRKIEALAPNVVEREPVNTPLQTGLKVIDALIPIGRGQRELIIGDRQTGKTAIAIDTIINQKDENVICIYVAIGQKATTVVDIVRVLKEREALDYTIVISATANEPASLLYIAPYSGCAIGEEFMYQGKDVLIIYDDLSKHAKAYREISLLLRRPPGREAYPGDIFYLHSRLLERSAKLNSHLGGGSLTALPIVETQLGDISAYIPTNLISITDGQIYLDSSLFYEGIRPAVDVGLSVSRVGGSAQIKAMREISGRLRLDLAQYREVETFAQVSTDIDSATKNQIERGIRIREVLKQPQYSPMEVIDQVIILFTVTRGYMDEIALEEIPHFQDELIKFINQNYENLKKDIKDKGLTDENSKSLSNIIFEFKRTFSSE